MDPNANLDQMRRLAEYILGVSNGMTKVAAENLAELVQALDGWLSHGGFLPEEWKR